MATRTKVKSGLDVAREEKADLENRLAKARHIHAGMESELKELWNYRLSPSGADDGNVQRRSIEVRQLLTDQQQVIEGLEQQLAEREKILKELEHATAKQDVATECKRIEAGFFTVIGLLESHVPEMQTWVAAAHEAHSQFRKVNRSDALELVNKLAAMGHLMDQLKNLGRQT